MRLAAATAAAGALVLVTAACGTTAASQPASPSAPVSAPSSASAAPTPSGTGMASPASPVSVSGEAWAHVHTLAYDRDGALVLGTHSGLFAQQPGRDPSQLSDTAFDVMGLARDGSRWLASGHPGKDEDLPSDLGLRASVDGRQWESVSLLGQVDFHRLTAAGSTVLGVSAHDGALLRSTDAGGTWTQLDNPGVFDIAVDPSDPTRVIATAESGPLLSADAGSTWKPLAGAPLVALVAWADEAIVGVAPDGTVHASADAGATWQQRGSAGGRPTALAAAGDRIAVLVGSAVRESVDGGAAFTDRLTGIGG